MAAPVRLHHPLRAASEIPQQLQQNGNPPWLLPPTGSPEPIIVRELLSIIHANSDKTNKVRSNKSAGQWRSLLAHDQSSQISTAQAMTYMIQHAVVINQNRQRPSTMDMYNCPDRGKGMYKKKCIGVLHSYFARTQPTLCPPAWTWILGGSIRDDKYKYIRLKVQHEHVYSNVSPDHLDGLIRILLKQTKKASTLYSMHHSPYFEQWREYFFCFRCKRFKSPFSSWGCGYYLYTKLPDIIVNWVLHFTQFDTWISKS